MRKFFYWWLAMVTIMCVSVVGAWLLSLVATEVARQSNFWMGLSVMLLIVSTLTAAALASPPPPWFRKLSMRLSDL